MNTESRITTTLKQDLRINQDFNPFNNTFFWEPKCVESESKIDALAVLTNERTYSESSCFQSMNVQQQNLLSRHFNLFPIHKTNSVTINGFAQKELSDEDYRPVFVGLMNNHIKSKVILVFSEYVQSYLTKYFKHDFEQSIDQSKLTKGLVEIGAKYYFVYNLCGLLNSENSIALLGEFIAPSTVYDYETALHLNYIKENHPTLGFPIKPLEDKLVRTCLANITQSTYFSVSNLVPRIISEMAPQFPNFDACDLIAFHYLSDISSPFSIGVTRAEYLELRTQTSSKEICNLYFGSKKLAYLGSLLRLSLIRYYLFVTYPSTSFDMLWKNRVKEAESVLDDYQSRSERLEEFFKIID